ATSRPAPYSAGLPLSPNRKGPLIFSILDATVQDRFENFCVLHKAPAGLLVGVGTIESVCRYCLLRSTSVPAGFEDGGVGRLVVAAPVVVLGSVLARGVTSRMPEGPAGFGRLYMLRGLAGRRGACLVHGAVIQAIEQ